MRVPGGVYWCRVNGGDWVLAEFRSGQLTADLNAAFLDVAWAFDWRSRIKQESFAVSDDLAAEILARVRPRYIDAEVRAQSNPSLN